MLRLLAIDFGASSGRVILGEYQDGKIELKEIHRFPNEAVNVNGVLYWDILRLFHEVKVGILKAKLVGKFDYIGIDSWAVDFGLIGPTGLMLSNPVHYRDLRTEGYKELFQTISPHEIYSTTGIQFMRFNTLYQLRCMVRNEPDNLKGAQRLLFIPDLITYFLTGVIGTEYTIASCSQLLNAKTRNWDCELIKKAGLPKHLFGKIYKPGTLAGLLSEHVCDELQIEPVKVVRVASHDTASAVIAVPTLGEDYIYLSCGTWSLLGTELNEPLINDLTSQYNFTNEGGYNGKIRLLKNVMGLWLIQECRRQWHFEGQEYSFAELVAFAEEAPPFFSYIDPDYDKFGQVCNMPEEIKSYCSNTNQYVPQTVGEIIRCIIESLALKYRMIAERLYQCTQKTYENIHMIGGGIHNKLLCQMTANATNRKVIAGPVEATALGNVAVQLIAAGEIENINQAREIIKNSVLLEEYYPTEIKKWDKAYSQFCDIVLKKGD
ncbi:MAG: rhamnulokinase [Vallitaleaceae bacterium]|nr:rhamnulokinase [Vallitaleaceae bacterium]